MGAWPSIRFPFAISIFLRTSGFLKITPGKFIISANPMAQGFLNRDLKSVALRTAPDVSICVAGTQEGSMKNTFKGTSLADSAMN